MDRGKATNLILGMTIALLPLYNRVSTHDFNRTSKDNLLLIIFAVLTFLLPQKKRDVPRLLWIAFIYCMLTLVFNQWFVISLNVITQSFYIGVGLVFFMSYFEKHDKESIHYIKSGLICGCFIQSFLAIGQFFDFDLYPKFYQLIYPDAIFTNTSRGGGFGSALGSLGNTNLVGAYIALTAIALFEEGMRKFLFIPIVALIVIKSIMPIAAFAGGAIYYFRSALVKKWHLYFSAIAGMYSLYHFGSAHNLDSGRFEVWNKLFNQVTQKHFLIGQGPGWFPDQRFAMGEFAANPGNRHYLMLQEHNAFLTAFNIFGIALFALLLPVFLKFVFKEDKKSMFGAIMFATFINSYGHFTLHQSTVAVIIIVSACLCLSEGEKYVWNLER
jgi:hypothetical protein